MTAARSFLRLLARTAATAALLGLFVGTGAVVALSSFPGSPGPLDPEPDAFADAMPAPATRVAGVFRPAR